MQNKLLLHACCAVCATYSIIKVKNDGFLPVVYFYNPNIYPEFEYNRRLNELIKYSKKEKFDLIIDEYNPIEFYEKIKGFENCKEKGERCNKCFLLRLNKTAKKAKELDIKYFSTTLTISPHKISKNIFEAGEISAKNYGVEFLKYDFKKQDGFKHAQIIAKENNMYKQTYCGCEFSIRKEGFQ